MFVVRELKPFLKITKLCGFTPYSLEKIDLPIQKFAVVYSLLCAGLYGFLIYQRCVGVRREDIDKLFILMIIRTVLSVMVLWSDILCGIFYRRKLVTALQKIYKYDLATGMTFDKCFVRYSWIVIAFIFLNDICVTFFTYFSENRKPVLIVVIYNLVYLPMSFSIFKFTLIVYAIRRRLQRLNKMVMAGITSVVVEINTGNRRFLMKDVCWLHGFLASAIKDVNSFYEVPLFLWIVTLTFNTTSRIYSIGHNSTSLLLILREFSMILFFVVLLITVISVCHVTAYEANKTGSIMFSPRAKFVQNRTIADGEESLSVGQYFLFHPVHFSAAAGIITIHLPLLLTIAETMTTYLVILRTSNTG